MMLICALSVLASFGFSDKVLLYRPTTVEMDFKLYEDSIKMDVPVQEVESIENLVHKSYAISVSLPVVTADEWLRHVTEEYFKLNNLTVPEFKEKVERLSAEKRRVDVLVYEVNLRSGDEEILALLISREENIDRWSPGINLSAAMFEKGRDGVWRRTTLPEGHWVNRIPIFNVDSLRELAEAGALLVDENNVTRYLKKSEIGDFKRVELTE